MGVQFADVAGIDWYAEDSAPPLTVLKPAAFGPGQLLIAVITQEFVGGFADLTAPSGWTLAGSYTGITQAKIWYHVYTGSEPSTWDFGYSAGGDATLAMIRITDADLTPVIVTAATNLTVSSSEDSPTVTPTGLNDLLLCGLTNRGNGTFFSAITPGTMTDLGRKQYLDQFMGLYLAREYLTNGNATGVRTWTSVSPAESGGALSIAVKSSGFVDPDPPPNPPPPIVPPQMLREILDGRKLALVPNVSLTPQIRELRTGAASASSVTLTTSGNVQVGDTLVVLHGNDFYTAAQMLAPTGTAGTWTQQALGDNGTNSVHQKIWTRPVTVSGAQTVTCAPSIDEELTVHLYVIIGADPTTPVDVAAGGNGTTSTAHVCPSVTPTSVQPLLLFGVQSIGPQAYTPPQFVQAWNSAHPPSIDATAFTASQVATGGATGTRTMTASGSTPFASVTVAIQAPLTAGGASRTASDTAIATDAATRSLVETRTAADTAAATDAATRASALPRPVADAASATDTAGRSLTLPRPVGGAAVATDAAGRSLVLPRTAPSTAAAADTATGSVLGGGQSRTASDTAIATDAASRALVLARAASDTAAATDAATRTSARTRSAADTSAATDTTTRSLTVSRPVADTAAATDAATRSSARGRTATDTAAATDTATGVGGGGQSRSAADTAIATDAASRAAQAFSRTAPSTAAATDSVARAVARFRTASDTAAATDAAVKSLARTRTTADTAIATDVVTRAPQAFSRTAADTALAVDTAFGPSTGGITYRPFTGTTGRPNSGTTARPGSGTTARPGSGITIRPFTSVTPRP